MLDIQRRLARAGHDPGCDGGAEHAQYGTLTAAAVRRFQADRGLEPHGVCDRVTWASLVEAGYHLGDRILSRRQPMMRGDDVADLQRRLGQLGFDAGRIDGIFGPDTQVALADFQRNAGLVPDGVCGHDSVIALTRLGFRSGGTGIAAVREVEQLLALPKTLLARRVSVAPQGLSIVAVALARRLRRAGAEVVVLEDGPEAEQAQATNHFQAEVCVALHTADSSRVSFYGTADFVSPGGERLARLLVDHLRPVIEVGTPTPMQHPILRETRMPAVCCELGPAAQVTDQASSLTNAIERAVSSWVDQPVEPVHQ